LNAGVLRTLFVILVAMIWTLLCQIPVTISVLLTFSGDGSAWMARKIWAPVVLWAAGVKIEADPFPHLERNQPYIFMANHQSFFDVAAAYFAINHPFRYVAKKSLVYVPILGWYLLMSGHILIDRGDRHRALRSLRRAGDKIAKGISILIFPEGTRSQDGTIRELKKGPFLLALLAQVPIVPVAIEGSRAVLSKGSFRVTPGTIRIRLGEPIPTKGMTLDDRGRLMGLVHEKLVEAHRAIGGSGVPTPAIEGGSPGGLAWPGTQA
jgi:1-acyl-sn-glycerol-3-phosphate acyltransferase